MSLDCFGTESDLMNLPGEDSPSVLELSNQRRDPGIIRSFGPLLVSHAISSKSYDALDELNIVEQMLPKVLANMPERESGERELTLDTLLGPPQFSAGLRLIEVIIYLCSNSLLPGATVGNNEALHWIADNIPIQSMGNFLRDGLPTLQAFRFQLLRFGVQTGRESLVADLLRTDDGLKEFALRSTPLLSETIRDNNVEMTKLLLKFGYDVLRPEKFRSVKRGLLRDCQSVTMARLLSKEVAVTVSEDASVKTIGDSALLSAIQKRDIEMLQFLIEAGANVNVYTDEGWWADSWTITRRKWDSVLNEEGWGKVTALSLAVLP